MSESRPFRWNLAKREQLGRLLEAAPRPQAPYAGFYDDLRAATARVLAFSAGADLGFVGRSPENFFDYLSGAFGGRDAAPDLHLVPFSMRWARSIEAIPSRDLEGLFGAFAADGLHPGAIASKPAGLALVDFVAEGGTFENLCRVLKRQAEFDGVDWSAVARRLRLIGLRPRTKNSPNTYRWQQHQDWLDLIPETPIRNVSAPMRFAYHIANDQPKVTESHHRGRWADPSGRPNLSPERLSALAFAADLYDRGAAERLALAKELARPRYMREPATRRLIAALRG